ncbi:hypothetical protein FACS1894182_11380 [Bacteroidia bacterium]|nr:hypothetical protein FACS1894182_11380 [Bacteroidia bacterium]
MLYTQTLSNSTLELLKTLMQDERMQDFLLAGGTNLALLLGHRKSIDLDFFSYQSFDSIALAEYLTQKYDLKTSDVRSENTLKGFIQGVKIDVIAHIYPFSCTLYEV